MNDKDSKLIFEAYAESTEIDINTSRGNISGSTDIAAAITKVGITSSVVTGAVTIASLYAPWQSVLLAAIPGVGGMLATFGLLGYMISRIPGVRKLAGVIIKRLFTSSDIEKTNKGLEVTINKIMELDPSITPVQARQIIDILLAEVSKNEKFQSHVRQLAQKCDGPTCDDKELLQLVSNIDNTKKNIMMDITSEFKDNDENI